MQKYCFIILYIRNSQQELHDIKFDFRSGQDTPDGIAQELVGAGLVNGMDKIIGKLLFTKKRIRVVLNLSKPLVSHCLIVDERVWLCCELTAQNSVV